MFWYTIQQWGVVPEKVGEKLMSVRGLVSVVIGVVAFVVSNYRHVIRLISVKPLYYVNESKSISQG